MYIGLLYYISTTNNYQIIKTDIHSNWLHVWIEYCDILPSTVKI